MTGEKFSKPLRHKLMNFVGDLIEKRRENKIKNIGKRYLQKITPGQKNRNSTIINASNDLAALISKTAENGLNPTLRNFLNGSATPEERKSARETIAGYKERIAQKYGVKTADIDAEIESQLKDLG